MPAVLWLHTTGECSRKKSDNGDGQQSIIWEKLYAFRLYSNVVYTQEQPSGYTIPRF